MASFVLVHGAFHGAWCWTKIVPRLEALGHSAIAIDLPSHGADLTPLDRVTMADWTARVVVALRAASEPVILVGHSMGGMAVAAAAEEVPEGVSRLVFVAGYLPANGDSVLSLSGLIPREEGSSPFMRTPDGLGLMLKPGAAANRFYGRSAPDDIAYAEARLRPLAPGLQKEPVALSEARFGSIPRAYVACRQDRIVPFALQEAMLARVNCDPVVVLDTDHSPFFSAPDDLVGMLAGLSD
jgi:pimeloyl-ACP methyl ester carboxylesterase